MSQQIRTQILFTENTKYGEFTDAIYMTQEEYVVKTQEEIDALKQERVDNYVSAIDNASTPKEPTKEELQAELAHIEAQKAELEAKIVELNAKTKDVIKP